MEQYDPKRESVTEFRTRTDPRALTVDLLEPWLKDISGLDKIHTVFTHGFDGDLGHHKQHKELAKVASIVFWNRELFHFTWDRNQATHKLSLSKSEHAKKLDLIKRYDPVLLKHKLYPIEYYIK